MGQNSPLDSPSVQCQTFLGAVFAGQDDEAESLSQLLTEADVPALTQLISVNDIAQISAQTADAAVADNPEERLADIRWWAIRGLANCGNLDVMARLSGSLADANPEIRSVAALSLGHIGQRSCSALLGNASEAQKRQEPIAEWQADVDKALLGIAALLNDPVGYVRQTASDALALFGGAAVPTLQTVIESDSEPARVRAAYALRKIGTKGGSIKETAPALFQLLNDSNYLVHTYAHEALDEMGLLDNVLVVL